jgi:hypothetical protein
VGCGRFGGGGVRNWMDGRRRRGNRASGEAGGGTLHLEFVWEVGTDM